MNDMPLPTFKDGAIATPQAAAERFKGYTITSAPPLTGTTLKSGMRLSVADKQRIEQMRMDDLTESVKGLEKARKSWNPFGIVKYSFKSLLANNRLNNPITDEDVELANEKAFTELSRTPVEKELEDQYRPLVEYNKRVTENMAANATQKISLPADTVGKAREGSTVLDIPPKPAQLSPEELAAKSQREQKLKAAIPPLPPITKILTPEEQQQLKGFQELENPIPIRYIPIPSMKELAEQKTKEIVDETIIQNLQARLRERPSFLRRVAQTGQSVLSDVTLNVIPKDFRDKRIVEAEARNFPKSETQKVIEGGLGLAAMFVPYMGLEYGAVKIGRGLRAVGAIDDMYNAYPYLSELTARVMGVTVGDAAIRVASNQEYGARDFLLNIGLQGAFEGALGGQKARIMAYLDNEVFNLTKALKRAPTPEELLVAIKDVHVPGQGFTWGHLFAEQRLAYKGGIDPNSAMPRKGIPGIDFPAPIVPVEKSPLMLPKGRKVVSKATGSAEEIVRGLRIDKSSSLAAQQSLREALVQHPDILNSRMRGVISNADAVAKARSIQVSKEELLNMPLGKTVNREQLTAINQFIDAHAEHVKVLRDLADVERIAGNSQVIQTELIHANMEHVQLLAVRKGLFTEAGRVVESAKHLIDPMSNLAKKINEIMAVSDKDTVEAIARRMAGVDPNDLDGMRQIIIDFTRPNKMKILKEISISSKLWRIKTQIVNTTSNSLKMLVRPIFKTGVATTDAMRVATMRALNLPAERERFYAEAFADVKGMFFGYGNKKEGVRSGLSNAFYIPFKTQPQAQNEGWWLGVKSSIGEAWKALLDEQYATSGIVDDAIGNVPAIRGNALQPKWISKTLDFTGKVIRLPFRLLNTSDVAFKTINYGGEMAGLAARIARKEGLSGDALSKRMIELINNPTDAMITTVDSLVKKSVFQEPLGVFTRKIQEMRNIPVYGDLLSITALPFFKTPVNLLKQGFDPMNPFLLARGMKKGGGEASEAITRFALGSATLYTLFQYSLEEKLTGAPPADQALREQLYAQGWQPWSIRIGDKYYSYDRIEPFGQIFRMVAAIGDAYRETGEVNTQMVTGAFLKMMRYTVDRSYIRGMNDTLNAMFDPDRYADKWWYSFMHGNIPFSGTFTELTSLIDTDEQGNQILRDQGNSFTEYFKARFPTTASQMEQRFDSKGRPVKIRGNPFTRTFSPVRVSSSETPAWEIETIIKEFYKIKKFTKETGEEESVVLNQAMTYVNQWKDLTAEQRLQNYLVLKEKNPDIAKQVLNILGKNKGVSFIEETLRNRSVDVRVKYINNLRKKMSKGEFAELYIDWKRKKIITPDVSKELLKLPSEQ